MSAPALSRPALVTLIRESNLIPTKQLDSALAQCRSDDPNALLSQLFTSGLITEYQGRELFAGRNKGFFIGKYKVLRPLATGGMGVILHCEHVHMHHQVALKLLPREFNDDTSAVTRFYREARAVAAVKHPNIVQAYDVGQEGTWHCLVLEFVDGINLHKLVANHGILSEVRAAHFMSQAAAGLQAIMQNGLVHRDLKPGNLVLARDNTIKILDLGLARFLDQRSDDLTRQMSDEQVLGTADFISPEQSIRSHDVDIRADIYSLGMTFYFLLAGRFPFKVASVAGKLMAHQTRMPKGLRNYRPDISRHLDEIILKMIQKKPEDRYTTPQEVVDVLRPWTDVPLPLPEPEWFSTNSSMFPSFPSTVVKPTESPSTVEAPSVKTTLLRGAPEPPTVVPHRGQAAASPLDELEEASSFSLSKASREENQATPRGQWKLGLVIGLTMVIALVIGLLVFLKTR